VKGVCSLVPTATDEITIMGMNVPYFQEAITKSALLGDSLLIVMIAVRIIRSLKKRY
jgi:hypothetical protein